MVDVVIIDYGMGNIHSVYKSVINIFLSQKKIHRGFTPDI